MADEEEKAPAPEEQPAEKKEAEDGDVEVKAKDEEVVEKTAEELAEEEFEEEEVFREEDEPALVKTKAHCFDAVFHPTEDIICAAIVTGEVEFHKYDWLHGSSELVRSLACHKDSCRSVKFFPADSASAEGSAGSASSSTSGITQRMVSTAANGFCKVTDVETGKPFWKSRMPAGGSALLPKSYDTFIIGDDDGHISLFDIRQKKAVVEYSENEDFITDLAIGREKIFCATSGDGTLAVYDIRKTGTKGLFAMSDFQDDEFLSLTILREGSKVVCGSQTGVLCMFSWDNFGSQNDRIKGHPMSVESVVKYSETGILSGSSDGKVRATTLYSKEKYNQVLGVVAEHGHYPIEKLSLSPCGEKFCSVSHGQPAVKIWPMDLARKVFDGKQQLNIRNNDVDSDDSDPPKKKAKRIKKGRKKTKIVIAEDERLRTQNDTMRQAKNFFGGL